MGGVLGIHRSDGSAKAIVSELHEVYIRGYPSPNRVCDYDGNGTTDVVIYRPSNGAWYLKTPTPQAVFWGGLSADVPVCANVQRTAT